MPRCNFSLGAFHFHSALRQLHFRERILSVVQENLTGFFQLDWCNLVQDLSTGIIEIIQDCINILTSAEEGRRASVSPEHSGFGLLLARLF